MKTKRDSGQPVAMADLKGSGNEKRISTKIAESLGFLGRRAFLSTD
jgi:hypothetical protein